MVIGDGDGDGATVVEVVVVVLLSGTGVGGGTGVVDVVVVLLSGTGVGFTVVVVVVEVVDELVVVFLSSGVGLGVVVVELLSGAAVVVFLSSIIAAVVDVMSKGTAAAAWSVPHATVAIMRQDTPTTNANLEGVIIAPFCLFCQDRIASLYHHSLSYTSSSFFSSLLLVSKMRFCWLPKQGRIRRKSINRLQ